MTRRREVRDGRRCPGGLPTSARADQRVTLAPGGQLHGAVADAVRQGHRAVRVAGGAEVGHAAREPRDHLGDQVGLLGRGERPVPGYNVMGICKAALDSAMKYMAFDLGADGIRVNALSAGPLKTLAGTAAGVGEMLYLYEAMAPLQRNITHLEVGRTGAFLLGDHSDGITGEIMHVDGGYNIMGSPGRMLDKMKAQG